jgi:hypothetical protein
MNLLIIMLTIAAFEGTTVPIVTQAPQTTIALLRMDHLLIIEPCGVKVNKPSRLHAVFPTNKPSC